MNRDHFQKIYTGGTQVRGLGFSLRVVAGSGEMGITSTRKIGCIARRNRQERRLAEALQQTNSELLSKMDCIGIAQPALRNVCFTALVLEVEWSIRQAAQQLGLE